MHAGRLPFTDLDAVCCFAVEAAMALHGEHTYYCRYVFGSGPAARAALVCCTRVASYDSLGRLVQVLPLALPSVLDLHRFKCGIKTCQEFYKKMDWLIFEKCIPRSCENTSSST